jgi:hypothetical protein
MSEQTIDQASPVAAEEVYEDYYGFAKAERFTFPDGKQYIDFQIMNEGAKARFQKDTNRDVTVMRQTGDAKMKMDPAAERHALLEASITGWNLMRREGDTWVPVPYSATELKNWLRVANPKIVEEIELQIRKANPWMQADMSVEDIDKEIDRLKEMREIAEKREAGNASSSAK